MRFWRASALSAGALGLIGAGGVTRAAQRPPLQLTSGQDHQRTMELLKIGSLRQREGMFLAAAGAGPVYELLAKKGLPTGEFPPIEMALIDGDGGFRQHSGRHTPGPNGPTFLIFASRYLPSSPAPK